MQALLNALVNDKQDLANASQMNETVLKFPKLLKKLINTLGADGEIESQSCPCCTRSLDADELKVTYEQLKLLTHKKNSPLLGVLSGVDDDNAARITALEQQITTVTEGMTEWQENIRLVDEVKELKTSIASAEEEYEAKRKELDVEQGGIADKVSEGEMLAELSSDLHKLRDDGTRIDKKKKERTSKENNMKMMNPDAGDGMTVKSLEADVKKALEDKDKIMKDIQDLNKVSGGHEKNVDDDDDRD